ncbi:MAG: hypothetical protein Q9227_000005 [Pyrenula ochraceoflavens]
MVNQILHGVSPNQIPGQSPGFPIIQDYDYEFLGCCQLRNFKGFTSILNAASLQKLALALYLQKPHELTGPDGKKTWIRFDFQQGLVDRVSHKMPNDMTAAYHAEIVALAKMDGIPEDDVLVFPQRRDVVSPEQLFDPVASGLPATGAQAIISMETLISNFLHEYPTGTKIPRPTKPGCGRSSRPIPNSPPPLQASITTFASPVTTETALTISITGDWPTEYLGPEPTPQPSGPPFQQPTVVSTYSPPTSSPSTHNPQPSKRCDDE